MIIIRGIICIQVNGWTEVLAQSVGLVMLKLNILKDIVIAFLVTLDLERKKI